MGTRVPCRYKKGNPYTYPIVPLPQPLGGNPYPCQSLRTPHEMLKGEMPNIDHLHVFGCGAFVYLPATARANKMTPKLELMTYVSVAPGNERNFLFMHSNNAVFTTAHGVFDECHFPHCPQNWRKPLENPFGRANPKPTTNRPGNPPEDINSDDDVEHDHGYPHPHTQDDDPKHEEPETPEEEPICQDHVQLRTLIRLLWSHRSTVAQLRTSVHYSGPGRAHTLPLSARPFALDSIQSLPHFPVYPVVP